MHRSSAGRLGDASPHCSSGNVQSSKEKAIRGYVGYLDSATDKRSLQGTKGLRQTQTLLSRALRPC
jgi:hypothetical protein